MMKRGTFVCGVGLVAAGSSLSHVGAQAGPLATPPPDFASNRNYFMYGGGAPIRGLRVTIDVDQEIVAPNAMSMQLNGNSPQNADCVYQQYCTNFAPLTDKLQIAWSIENFPSQAYRLRLHNQIGLPCGSAVHPTLTTCKGNLYNYPLPKVPFTSSPGPSDRIPAGFKIIFELKNDDRGAIVGATYTVQDNHGRRTSSGPVNIHQFTFAGTQTRVGEDGVAPILAFQMNLVGRNGGVYTQLTSGAGRITYEATTKLRPMAGFAEMPGVYSGTPGTAETSNVTYSKLPAAPAHAFTQKFSTPLQSHPQSHAGLGSSTSCPSGQTYNSLTKQCGFGHGKTITNDKAPPPKPPR